MRTLVYVPIIHTEVDMGSMAKPLKQEYVRQYGKAKWQEHIRAVHEMWEGIQRKVAALKLTPRRLRIYQDGLPICGRELEIVREVASLGSKNHQIILALVEQGAHVEGTEDPKHLMEEYLFVKQLTELSDPQEKQRLLAELRPQRNGLLQKRDRFIAKRIAATLKPRETGLLFSGIEHQVDKYLPKHIKVSYLIYRLPFRRLRRPA